MKLIEIKDEEFLYRGFLFKLETIDNKVKLKFIRKYEGKKKGEFHPPTPPEVLAYFHEKGYSQESAAKFFDFYNVADWKDSNGKQIINWKQKAVGIWFKEPNKIKQTLTQDFFQENV